MIFRHDSRGFHDPVFEFFFFRVADPPRASLEPAGRVGSTPRCRASFSVRVTPPFFDLIFRPDSRGFHDSVFEFSFFVSPTRPEAALSPPGESGRLPDVVQLFLFESPRLVLISYFGPTCVGIMTPMLIFHFFVSSTRPDPAMSPPGEPRRLP